jgi:hypothetical protein
VVGVRERECFMGGVKREMKLVLRVLKFSPRNCYPTHKIHQQIFWHRYIYVDISM